MPGRDRRAGHPIVLPVFLTDDRCSVEQADGEVVGFGYRPYLDEARTVELVEDDRSPVLPGVFYTRVAGVSFHDDVLQLPHFCAGEGIEIRYEPANPVDRNALAVFGGGYRVGYLPGPIAEELARRGARVMVVARRQDRLEQTASACRMHAPASFAQVADVADRGACEHVAAQALERFGSVDANSASRSRNARLTGFQSPFTRPYARNALTSE